METIHKYGLATAASKSVVEIPQGDAEVFRVALQRGKPVLWAKVDTDAPMVKRTFHVYVTGQHCKVPVSWYIGTVLMYEDTFVLHYFLAPE